MERKIAKIITYVFHPLFIPTYAFLLLFSLKSYTSFRIPFSAKMSLIIIVFVSTCVFPVIMMYFLKRKEMIKSFKMNTKEERIFPCLMTAVFYYINFYLFNKLNIPEIYSNFLLGATILVIEALIFNFWWKISIHMIAIGGLTTLFISISILLNLPLQYLVIMLFFVSGLIGFARLRLNTHNSAQVYTGFLIGALTMLIVFFKISL